MKLGNFKAIVTKAPADPTDTLMITIPAVSDVQEFGPVVWTPTLVLPAVGDDCLVAFDNVDTPWVLAFLKSAVPSWHEASSPPSGPQTNDLWLFHPVVGVSWTFRYEPDQDATYPWQFIGGPPLRSEVLTEQSPTIYSTWHDLATNGPDHTFARAGVYDLEYGFFAYTGNNGWKLVHAGPTGVGGTPTIFACGTCHNGAGHISPMLTHQATVTAGQVMRLRYYVTDINAVGNLAGDHIRERWFKIRPLRVA